MLPLSLAEAPEIAGADYFVVVVIAAIAVGALVFALYLYNQVMRADQGTPRMQDIARAVQEGAAAYLNRQFKTLSAFVLIVFVLLLILPVNEGGAGVRIGRSVFFVVGAVLLGARRLLRHDAGRRRATCGSRPPPGWRRPRPAMRIAFRTGGLSACHRGPGSAGRPRRAADLQDEPHGLEGFGFGAALLAMFMRVGGGIFTKAADVGADLVGKVEAAFRRTTRERRHDRRQRGDNVGDAPAWPPTSSSRTR